jgi:hypothetical protein
MYWKICWNICPPLFGGRGQGKEIRKKKEGRGTNERKIMLHG